MREKNVAVLVGLVLGWSAALIPTALAMVPRDKFVFLASPSWFAKFDGLFWGHHTYSCGGG